VPGSVQVALPALPPPRTPTLCRPMPGPLKSASLTLPPATPSFSFCHPMTYCRLGLSAPCWPQRRRGRRVSAPPPQPLNGSRAAVRPRVLPGATTGGCAGAAAKVRHAAARPPGNRDRRGRGAGLGRRALRRRANWTTRHLPLPPTGAGRSTTTDPCLALCRGGGRCRLHSLTKQTNGDNDDTELKGQ